MKWNETKIDCQNQKKNDDDQYDDTREENEINLKCPKQEMKKKKENFNLKTFVWHLPERRASTCTVIVVKNINAVAAIIIR